MIVATLMGILDGVPNGEHRRMHEYERLTSESGIPEIGVLSAVSTRRTADDTVFVKSDKETAVTAFDDTLKELLTWYVAFGLQQVMLTEQAHERSEFLFTIHLSGDDATLVGFGYTLLHTLVDALFRGMTVQRVVDAHPMDGKELLLSELLVGKHLLAEVTYLYI